MKIKLHYAELNNQGDIPCIELTKIQFLNFFRDKFKFNHDKVYIFTYDYEDVEDYAEVLVTSSMPHIYSFIQKNWQEFDLMEIEDYFLQEYPSYEEAYKVALSMKEVSPLCYDKEINPNNN